MPIALYSTKTAALHDRYVWMFGGFKGEPEDSSQVVNDRVLVFDAKDGTWEVSPIVLDGIDLLAVVPSENCNELLAIYGDGVVRIDTRNVQASTKTPCLHPPAAEVVAYYPCAIAY